MRGLTEEQRTARRRSLHRDIDATRRSREAAAISRLHGLLQGHKQALLIEDDRGVRSAKSAGAGRVRVLEQCAEVIERLQSMRQAMERASNAKDQQLRILADHLHSVAAAHAQSTLACIDCSPSSDSLHCEDSSTSASASPSTSTSSSSSPLSALPAPLSATLSHLHRSSSLRADSTLGSSSLCVLVKLMPSSVLVSASARFCQQSGYREQDLVGTTMTQEVRPGTCPLLMQRGGGDRGEEGWGRGGPQQRAVQQYGRSEKLLMALLSGEVERVEQRWRCVLANGQQYEVPAFWSASLCTQLTAHTPVPPLPSSPPPPLPSLTVLDPMPMCCGQLG